eukprot:1079573-Pelagomonas_calceolata.AAC.8
MEPKASVTKQGGACATGSALLREAQLAEMQERRCGRACHAGQLRVEPAHVVAAQVKFSAQGLAHSAEVSGSTFTCCGHIKG